MTEHTYVTDISNSLVFCCVFSVTRDDSSSEKFVHKKADNPTSAELKSFLASLSAILLSPVLFHPNILL